MMCQKNIQDKYIEKWMGPATHTYVLDYYLCYDVDQINLFNINKYLYITKLFFIRKKI
jgi:hypothetical protein